VFGMSGRKNSGGAPVLSRRGAATKAFEIAAAYSCAAPEE
jgi:hypothetical protein